MLLLQDEKWLADSMECYGYLRNVQDLPSDGNVWFDDGISSYFFERPVKTPPVQRKSSARNVPRVCIVCGWHLERRQFGRRHCVVGKCGRVRHPCSETQCKGTRRTMVKTSFSRAQMEQLNCLEEIRFSQKSALMRDQPQRGEELSGDLRGSSDGSQPLDERMTVTPEMFFGRRE